MGLRGCGFCAQVVLALGDYMSVQCHSCIGGTNVGEDIRKLDYGQHVVSGTPGRVFGEPQLLVTYRQCGFIAVQIMTACLATSHDRPSN